MLWHEHPSIWNRIEKLEKEIGHTLMTPGKHKIWPHGLSALRQEFQNGRMPREIVRWQKTGVMVPSKRGCKLCSL